MRGTPKKMDWRARIERETPQFEGVLCLPRPDRCRNARRAVVNEIRAELSALGRLSGAEGDPDSLSGLAREAAALGAWSKAGRLASARDHAPFFFSETTARTRREQAPVAGRGDRVSCSCCI